MQTTDRYERIRPGFRRWYCCPARAFDVSGEESARQIKLRAERIGKFTDDLYLFSETCIGTILQAVDEVKPEVLIVDSIQTVFEESVDAAPGSVSQVREITSILLHWQKVKILRFLLSVM